MTGIIVAAVLSAILAGTLGYVTAVIKRDTSIALLERGQSDLKQRLADVDKRIVEQNEKIDRHLQIFIRVIIDFARHSGMELRAADVLEIASLEPGDKR